MISRIHVPALRPEDVIPHLGKPSHYREGRSAFCLVNAWMALGGRTLPDLIAVTLDTAPQLQGAELVEAFLEREVELGDGRRPSQTDLLALLRVNGRLAVMSVEAKVDEPFGKLVSDELIQASPGKRARIERLSAMLGIDTAVAAGLRYQLIHRTAAAILEARRFCSNIATMMVHSFDREDCGVDDYRLFARAMGFPEAAATSTAGPVEIDGVELFLGWTADRPGNEGFSVVDRRKTESVFLMSS